jgi:hypothetical protein
MTAGIEPRSRSAQKENIKIKKKLPEVGSLDSFRITFWSLITSIRLNKIALRRINVGFLPEKKPRARANFVKSATTVWMNEISYIPTRKHKISINI